MAKHHWSYDETGPNYWSEEYSACGGKAQSPINIQTSKVTKVFYFGKSEILLCVRFISFSKCSNWRQISKLASNFGCLFTFCYSAWANLLKTKLQTCNLQTGQSISYKYVNQFWLNLPHSNSKKLINIQSLTTISIFNGN